MIMICEITFKCNIYLFNRRNFAHLKESETVDSSDQENATSKGVFRKAPENETTCRKIVLTKNKDFMAKFSKK